MTAHESPGLINSEVDEFELRLNELKADEAERVGRRQIWLAHHWPDHYQERCLRVGGRHVCRRCAALYPLGFVVAALTVAGYGLWPTSLDVAMIWGLSIPATVAYCGEALGFLRYDPRWQVATTLLAALAFGRALGYELLDRWSPEFWGPIAVFGGIWFLATALAVNRR